jgi:hypothetical protein
MEGDFTRNSSGPLESYSGVLMQQGRVQLDSDWNEQWAIHMRSLRLALKDIIGQHGGPARDWGFKVERVPPAGVTFPQERIRGDVDLFVGTGTYYVDGIRLALREWQRVETGLLPGQVSGDYLVYLEVWERHVNAVEAPAIREVALLGPDTATRAEILWRVNLLRVGESGRLEGGGASHGDKLVAEHLRARIGLRLAAQARTEDAVNDPCKLSPGARYRGPENQLYRVEIHRGGSQAASHGDSVGQDEVLFSFKWSRENGSVVFPIERYSGPKSVEEDKEVSVTRNVTTCANTSRHFGGRNGRTTCSQKCGSSRAVMVCARLTTSSKMPTAF